MNTREVIRVFCKGTNLRKFSLFVQQLQNVISALQSNETSLCSLSKVVQQVKSCQIMNFHESVMNIREFIRVFCKSTNFRNFFLSVQQLQNVISAFQSYETALCSSSKVVQRVRICQNINFHEPSMNTHEVIRVFCKGTNLRKFFVHSETSECIFDTLVR